MKVLVLLKAPDSAIKPFIPRILLLSNPFWKCQTISQSLAWSIMCHFNSSPGFSSNHWLIASSNNSSSFLTFLINSPIHHFEYPHALPISNIVPFPVRQMLKMSFRNLCSEISACRRKVSTASFRLCRRSLLSSSIFAGPGFLGILLTFSATVYSKKDFFHFSHLV